ncbi:MAG: NAD(P)/FAD-dependent oxidoreductase [Oscillospiraceae bacterium]|jgi:thioredoxin reductase (NADPH)|nr:NAD(P)/FAD-dependent oxidoreductase [Oscillospiraceae bacterium]
MKYDVIIVGGGAAGVSAALYTVRAGYKTLIAAKDNGALAKAEKIENYFGFATTTGAELLAQARAQAVRLGVNIVNAEVFGITETEYGFEVETSTANYSARAVVLAVGKQRKKPNIKRLDEFEGRGVSYCAVCDGAFYRGKNVAVIGKGEYAQNEAKYLETIVATVTVIDEANVTEITPNNDGKKVGGLRLSDGNVTEFDGVFVAVGTAGAFDFAKKLGLEIQNGNLITDDKQMTVVPMLFAAGDCTGGLLQIAKAVGEGAIAGNAAVDMLK